MKAVQFIGKKPSVRDFVTNSDLVWQNGETLTVPDKLADQLLRHPDVFAIDDSAAPLADDLPGLEVAAAKPEEEEITASVVPHNLVDMTKAQLSEYAMREFGIGFGPRDGKPVMLNAIQTKLGGRKFDQ